MLIVTMIITQLLSNLSRIVLATDNRGDFVALNSLFMPERELFSNNKYSGEYVAYTPMYLGEDTFIYASLPEPGSIHIAVYRYDDLNFDDMDFPLRRPCYEDDIYNTVATNNEYFSPPLPEAWEKVFKNNAVEPVGCLSGIPYNNDGSIPNDYGALQNKMVPLMVSPLYLVKPG